MRERPFQGNDRFEIIRRLGAGGMGVVYEVFDKRRQTRVALKTLRDLDAGAVLRLKAEFRALQDLEHPNLVTLLELISDDDSWYFTMELVHGVSFLQWVQDRGEPLDVAPTLRDTSKETIHDTEPDVSPSAITAVDALSERRAAAPTRHPFHEPRLRAALRQLVAGLSALHNAGKVHRDIKPSNLMVGGDGRLVLLDFGLVSDLNAELRSSENVVGTIEYMAPEQAAARAVGPEADWYAVGVLLYEALTGRRPVEGHPLRVLQDKQWTVPTPPRQLVPEVPEDLDQLCMDLLRTDPRERPRQRELLQRLSVEAPSPTSGSAPSSGVFVGRTRELTLLAEAFERARKGQLQFVLISGPSGVGKSALARQLTRVVEDTPGLVVLRGRHYERESVPYRSADTIVDGLSRVIEQLPPEERERILPRDAGLLAQVFPAMRGVVSGGWRVAPGADRQELRHRLGLALRELFSNLARKSPVVGIIDDVQWADSDSQRLLEQTLRPPAPALMVVMTLRTPPGDTSLAAAWREGIRAAYGAVQHIDLEALSSEESRELAGKLLGDRLPSANIDAIASEASGHPLFIDALVRHTLLRGSSESVRLDEALQARIAELLPQTRLLLDLVVLADGPLAAETLMRAAAIEYTEFTRRTATLRIAGLVRTTRTRGAEALEPFHDRVRETELAALSDEERRAGHERLARALEAVGADVAALYLHHREAGNAARARHFAVLAAQQATEALAFEHAIGLYRSALELCEDEDERRRLRVMLGHALANAGRGPDAAEAFFSALEGAPPEEALELRRLGAEQLLRAGKFAEGMEAARSVLAQVGMAMPTSEWRAIASFLWSRLRVRLRGLGFRERAPDEIPRATLQRIDVCWSMAGVLAVADTLGGAPFQAKHLLSALSAGEPFRVARALALESGLLAAAGDKSERRALAVAERANQLARRLQHPYALAWARGGSGVVAALNGRWRDGFTACDESEQIFRGQCGGIAWELATMQLFTLSTLFYLGRMEELSRRVATGLREAEERGDAYLAQCHRTAPGVMSWLAAGDLAGAREQVQAPANPSRFHVEHCWRLIADGMVDLYAGEPAYQKVVERWPLVKTTIARVQLLRIEARLTRGRAALVAGGVAEARQLAKKVMGEGATWARPLGQLLLAGASDGDRRELLARALDGFRIAEMHLYAACAEEQLGRLIGGDEGAARRAGASQVLKSLRQPERVLAALAPGF
jgi:serine/threonine protein kinase/energy-coupling factor transporter ATP-binding protein EcfA2